MNVKLVSRQGDVYIYRIDKMPCGKRGNDAQTKRKILAFGEATGHVHQVTSVATEVFRITQDACKDLVFLKSKKQIKIVHGRDPEFQGVEPDTDYHEPITLPPGEYFTGIVQETDHMNEVVRRVVD